MLAGKGGGRGVKTGIAGVKRGTDALFQKFPHENWENATEPSEAALSDASAFPATTEASARCAQFVLATHPHNHAPPPFYQHPTQPCPDPDRAPSTHSRSCCLALFSC